MGGLDKAKVGFYFALGALGALLLFGLVSGTIRKVAK